MAFLMCSSTLVSCSHTYCSCSGLLGNGSTLAFFCRPGGLSCGDTSVGSSYYSSRKAYPRCIPGGLATNTVPGMSSGGVTAFKIVTGQGRLAVMGLS